MKAEINKHGCLVLTTTTVLEEKQLSDWLKINSGVVMNYAVDVNSEVNGIETSDDKCTLHIVSNNEAYEFRGTTNNVKFADEIEPPTHFGEVSEVAVCVIHECHNVAYKRGVCRECYLKLYNTNCLLTITCKLSVF